MAPSPRLILLAVVLAPMATGAMLTLVDLHAAPPQAPATQGTAAPSRSHTGLFVTSDNCMACHNSLTSPSGEDVSIGSNWRATMMANSSRDPYWQAGVRRETLDHPTASAAIQDECSICHMPMSRTHARANGRDGEVFRHLPVGSGVEEEDLLAYDGVSCTACHQITQEKLGTPDSFTGGYVVRIPPPSTGRSAPAEPRTIFGPFEIEKGLTTVMRSATDFQPSAAPHIQQSELCATCHTLITKALGPKGEVIGELPEQVMYLEWRHSAFQAEQKSCQSCHMPVVEQDTPIASVFGPSRKLARHTFVGGNFFMLRLLNKYRSELGVTALPQEFDNQVARTLKNLSEATGALTIERAEAAGGRLNLDLVVQNLTGHKFPTAYPSRRAWLHVTVREGSGRPIFESGAITLKGLIEGNDNDADGARFEPHYAEIRQADQVQIYESIMGDPKGVPTTGLLTAIGYLKDNRLLPRGFDKASADANVKVVGPALEDGDFTAGSDRVRYSIDLANATGPFSVNAELRFQVISFRWAENLRAYDALEPRRFVGYYDAMASAASALVASAATTVR